MAISNAPPNMAPFGEDTFHGTNPMAIGIPPAESPLIFDASTAWSLAESSSPQTGKAIPEVGGGSKTTTDANLALAEPCFPRRRRDRRYRSSSTLRAVSDGGFAST